MPDPRRIKQDSPHIASIPLAVGLLDPWPIGANHVHEEEGKRNQKDRPPLRELMESAPYTNRSKQGSRTGFVETEW